MVRNFGLNDTQLSWLPRMADSLRAGLRIGVVKGTRVETIIGGRWGATNPQGNLLFWNAPARPGEAFELLGQAAVQEVRQRRQGQVEVHVQANVAAQAVEVEGRDLFTKVFST
jgi:hypothetical protein